ncbi:MAG: hypothetical protein U0869_14250 [Chloroflexota bacterium]
MLTLGATTRIFSDTFDDPTRWSVTDTDAGSVAYNDGNLAITVTAPNARLSSTRDLPEPVPVLRVEADVSVGSGDGTAGLGCGVGAGSSTLLGELAGGDRWRIGVITDGAERTVGEGPLPATLDLAGAGSVRLAVECADTGTPDGDRIALWVDGELVGDTLTGSRLGQWDQAVLVASVAEPALVAFFDDALVEVGDRYAPVEADPAVLELLSHVPEELAAACVPRRTVGDGGVVAGVVCAPAGAADQAEYYRYASPDALAAAFDAMVARSSEELGANDCSVGPSLVDYEVTGGARGQVACFENRDTLGGRLIVWTDETQSILALGVRTTGGYPELYDWWLGAGPNP